MANELIAKYDDVTVRVTPEVEAALIAYMKAFCAMMAVAQPDLADCWQWGRCYVGDMSRSSCERFEFGGLEDGIAYGNDDNPELFAVMLDPVLYERAKHNA